MTLYYRYENNSLLADDYAKMLTSDFPDNPVFEKWRGRIAVRRGDYQSVDSIFNSVINKSDKKMFGYNTPNSVREAAYYLGSNLKNNGYLDSAKVYFQKCIQESQKIDEDGEESGFQVNAYVYLAQIEELLNHKDEAIRLYEKILDINDYGRSHSIAENSLKNLRSKN